MRDPTDRELFIIEELAKVWNHFCELPPLHPDEANEFKYAIHLAQTAIMARPVQEAANKERMK